MHSCSTLLTIIFLTFSGQAAEAQVQQVFIHLAPVSVEVNPGDTVRIEVRVEPGQNGISGGEVTVSFDPSLLQAMDIRPGDLLGSDPLVGMKEIDNQGGEVRCALGRVGVTPIPTSPGVFRFYLDLTRHIDLCAILRVCKSGQEKM